MSKYFLINIEGDKIAKEGENPVDEIIILESPDNFSITAKVLCEFAKTIPYIKDVEECENQAETEEVVYDYTNNNGERDKCIYTYSGVIKYKPTDQNYKYKENWYAYIETMFTGDLLLEIDHSIRGKFIKFLEDNYGVKKINYIVMI